MKLGKRLQALFNTISDAASLQAYDEIWDCCCDHGFLGIELLNKGICNRVHFVDQVADITDKLQKKLLGLPPETYSITTGSAADIQLDTSHRQLVILAGISGKTAINIMKEIHGNLSTYQHGDNKPLDISYLVSPNYYLYDVREYLIQQGLHLVSESLVFENNQANEIILVSTQQATVKDSTIQLPLSSTGNMWIKNDDQHRNYLNSLIKHYQKKVEHTKNIETQNRLDAYKKLAL